MYWWRYCLGSREHYGLVSPIKFQPIGAPVIKRVAKEIARFIFENERYASYPTAWELSQ